MRAVPKITLVICCGPSLSFNPTFVSVISDFPAGFKMSFGNQKFEFESVPAHGQAWKECVYCWLNKLKLATPSEWPSETKFYCRVKAVALILCLKWGTR